MDWLSAWWTALPLFEKILWCIAVPSSILTILQVILEIIGAGGHNMDFQDGADLDLSDIPDAHSGLFQGFHWFSVKGLIIFFTAFSWLSIGLSRSGLPLIFSLMIGTVIGLTCMIFFGWLFLFLARMAESGNLRTENARYQYGRVYLKIPANRTGKGKVTVTVQGTSQELFALTDGDEIPTGAPVLVIDILANDTLLVALNED